MDQIIDPHEIKQGFVNLKELLSIIENDPKRKAQWGVIRNKEDIYICECMWSTLGVDNFNMHKILPCI